MKKKSVVVFFILLLFFIAIWIFWLRPAASASYHQLLQKINIDKPNILFITLDTTRSDHLSCYGYKKGETPHLDRLAREGILFDQCLSPVALTLPSHCSIMTGLYPTFHGVRVNGNTALSESHLTLAELLNQNGYQCAAFIAAFVLDGRWGLKQGFHHYDDQFDLKKYKTLDLAEVQRPANEVVDSALNWLGNHKDQPFFSWIHLYDPHASYNPPEPYMSRYKDRGLTGLYDGEIAFMDEQIGRVLTWMENNRLDQNTIVIVVGDHGEGLGDHGEMAHGYFIYDYAIHVPLIIKTPLAANRGQHIKNQVRTIDIYPTLLEMIGLSLPQKVHGESLVKLLLNPGLEMSNDVYIESLSPNIQYGWSPLHGIRRKNYKFIDAPRPELYDMVNDPEESIDLRHKYPQLVKEMKAQLAGVMKITGLGAPKPEAANLDAETQRRLATLGYVGSPVARKKGKFLADPKDKLEVFNEISLAMEFINRDDHEMGAKTLQSVLEKDPLNPQAKLLLATCFTKMGRKSEAKKELDDILKDDPNSVKALILMANMLADEGKEDDVVSLCKKVLSVDDKNTQAFALLGETYLNKKEFQLALNNLDKAVEIQPKLSQNWLNKAAALIGLKQFDPGEKILVDIIAKTPKFPLAQFNLGLLYEETGQMEKALEAYRKEISNSGEFVPARFNYALLLFKTGQRQEYMNQLREVIKIKPDSAKGYLFLARGMLAEGENIDEIQKIVEKGLSITQENELKALAFYLLADIYSRKNQPQKVNECLANANFYKNKKES